VGFDFALAFHFCLRGSVTLLHWFDPCTHGQGS
jgi:hypothetical protein